MSFNEEVMLSKYEKELSFRDKFCPSKKYQELCFNLGKEYHLLTLMGKELPENANENIINNEKAYFKMLSEILVAFKIHVDKGNMKEDEFPIKDWKYIANRDETRFLMRDFYKSFAEVVENTIENDNADHFVQALGSLSGEEYSMVVGNLSNVKVMKAFINSIEKLKPEILLNEKFNPLESMINEGNPKFFEIAYEDVEIKELIKKGKIKDIEKLSISGELVRRLASIFDDEKKKNILIGLQMLNEKGISQKMYSSKQMENKNDYLIFSQIQPRDELSYMDIYLYAHNDINVLSNRNNKISEKFNLDNEKKGLHTQRNRP